MKRIFTTLLTSGVFISAFSQWSPTTMQGESTRNVNAKAHYSLDLTTLRSQLSKAQEMGKNSSAVIVKIPTLNGKLEEFKVYSLPVVVKSLADKYQLGSYTGVSVNDPTKFIRFSVAPNDFQSMITHNGKSEFIEPLNENKTVYGVFPKTQKTATDKAFECSTGESLLSKNQLAKLADQKTFASSPSEFGKNSDQKYRTYRLALSTTGEYTTFFGGVAGALTQMNATMTRVNGVFERDFAIHMILQDFPELIFPNASTDPYSNASTGAQGAWSREVQNTLTTTIGNAAYDIGHLFGRSGGGGSAGDLGNVCRDAGGPSDNSSKGSAYTSPGSGAPMGDTFDIDFVAHEMGHQFGAWHTFSHGLHAGSIAHMEPGSGSTIMGYAGVVQQANANVQMNSDDYFHAVSIQQVQDYVNTQSCDINTPITNTPPVIAALPAKSIPKGTAFVLEANATDAENAETLTYTWEQYDNASSAVTNVTSNNTTGAKFRSIRGTNNPKRYFPKESMVLSGSLGSQSEWESVSDVARSMRFRVTVRDNHPDVKQQQTQFAVQNITVTNDGPFKVTSTKLYNNGNVPLSWDVANTNNTPYNVTNVKIDYTTNNGTSWTTLTESTANDGSEILDFSSLSVGTDIKVRIKAIDNVFYAVGNATISTLVDCDGSSPIGIEVSNITKTEAKVSWDPINNATYNLRYRVAGETAWINVNDLSVNSYSFSNLVEDTSYEVEIAAVCSGTTGTYSPTKTFSTIGLVYCPVTTTDSTDEHISKVVLTAAGGVSMTSNSGASNYTDYSTDETRIATLIKGSSGNKIEVTKTWSGDIYPEAVAVWIDFNRNGTYEANEKVASTAPNQTNPATATFNVPADAYSGDKTVGMRVMLRYQTTPTNPCANYTYGEIEDYAVRISSVLSVGDINKSTTMVYPNPTKDVINISGVKAKSTYQIHNAAGQLVKTGNTDGKVMVSDLTKGVYVITVESNETKSQSKFIKN